MFQINIPFSEVAANLNDFSWKVINFLYVRKQVSFNELRQHVGLSQEKTYKEIARLEGALLIHSERDPNDQRSVRYSLTKYGEVAANSNSEKTLV